MIIERLRTAMKDKGLSQSELARRVGVTQGAIQQLLAGTARSSRHSQAIAKELEVSEQWLLGNSDDPSPGPFGAMTSDEIREKLGIARIRELDIGYAMGFGAYVPDFPDTTWANFDARWLARLTRSAPEKLFVAQGVGDSMMPTLLDNDVIIVDTGKAKVDQQDRIWALAYGELGMIKRVRKLPSGRFLIISDNPNVENFEADAQEIAVLGRIIWVGRST